MAGESEVPKIAKDTISIRLYDGTDTTPFQYILECRDAGFTFSPPTRESVDIYDVDDLCGSREGRFTPGSVSFSVHFRDFTVDPASPGISPANLGSLMDFLEATGPYDAAVPTGGDRYTGKVRGFELLIDGVSHNDGNNHSADAEVVRWVWDFAEGNGDLVNVSGVILSDVVRGFPAAP